MTKSQTTDAVNPEFAHKVKQENVLIEKVHCIDEKKGLYESKLIINTDHEFLYDYPFKIDHVPGVVIIEAAKQMSCVVAHEFWGIPMGYAFAPLSASSRFTRFVELETAPSLSAKLSYKKVMKEIFLADMQTKILQEDLKLGVLSSKFVFILPEAYKKIRDGMMGSTVEKMIQLLRKI